MNPWKKAFIALCALIGIFVIIVGLRLGGALNKKTPLPENTAPKTEGVSFEMLFENKELENLLNLQLEKQSVPMHIAIDEFVVLKGNIPILSYELPVEVKSLASGTAEGQIVLQIEEISGESIRFPRGLVLTALAQNLDPAFLEIEADKNRILLNPNQMVEGFSIHVREINTNENRIRFLATVDEKYLTR